MIWIWIVFHVFLFGVLALDLFVLHRKSHVVGMREATIWSLVWIAAAGVFFAGIYVFQGHKPALQFLTGYLIEKSLSVDNVFVFLMIFTYFDVPAMYHHRILFWGILGALVLRLLFILAGVALLERFHWLTYILGGFLVLTGSRMAQKRGHTVNPKRNPVFRLLSPLMASSGYSGGRFVVREAGRIRMTPLLLVLLVVESTDVVFALDSVPAVLAITTDTFIVYTSNALAILGLRALYFLISGSLKMFRYLHYGLAAILVFVGAKMLLAHVYKLPVTVALPVIVFILLVSIVASLAKHRPTEAK